MRYMGDVGAGIVVGPLDPAAKAIALQQAATLDDGAARDLADVSDATPYGKRRAWLRAGIGASAGLVLGLVVGRALKKRR